MEHATHRDVAPCTASWQPHPERRALSACVHACVRGRLRGPCVPAAWWAQCMRLRVCHAHTARGARCARVHAHAAAASPSAPPALLATPPNAGHGGQGGAGPAQEPQVRGPEAGGVHRGRRVGLHRVRRAQRAGCAPACARAHATRGHATALQPWPRAGPGSGLPRTTDALPRLCAPPLRTQSTRRSPARTSRCTTRAWTCTGGRCAWWWTRQARWRRRRTPASPPT